LREDRWADGPVVEAQAGVTRIMVEGDRRLVPPHVTDRPDSILGMRRDWEKQLARDHFIPAALLWRFSSDQEQPNRSRRLTVMRPGSPQPHQARAETI